MTLLGVVIFGVLCAVVGGLGGYALGFVQSETYWLEEADDRPVQ